MIFRFLWLRATIREVAKPDDTPLLGRTDGLLVISFTYLQKGNVFSLYTSFVNPRMNVNVHTQSKFSTPQPVKGAEERDAPPTD